VRKRESAVSCETVTPARPASSHESAPEPTSLRGGAFVLALLLAIAGLGISAYLGIVGLSAAGRPVGCGGGSGCEAVLTSRWAGVFGVPLGLPAALVWLVALHALLARRAATTAACAVMIALAGLWFIGLQFVAIGAICPWCIADHGIGLLFTIIVFARRIAVPAPRALLAGGFATALLIGGQLAIPYRPGTLGTLMGVGGGAGSVRVGTASFDASNAPSWGATDGKTTIVLLVDFACPHCRALHGLLAECVAENPKRFTVLVAPVPMDADCNPTVVVTEPRFEHSCELAQLALAVWVVDPARFAEFDRWLFAPEVPRSPAEAKTEAERITGADRLASVLRDPQIEAMIRRNIDAFVAVGARRLPVILRADGPSLEGAVESREELERALERNDGAPGAGNE
jgi:uncharacterized membrane protein/protein-disulfide isomerase